VKTVVNPTNLAYTGLGLGAHTDNPYREPTPTLQLLHCLASSAAGGENTLVDAFRVVQDLPRSDLELLAATPIRFRYADAATDLESETPVISLDAPGDLFIVDNLRVLHGRTGYAASGGERHLQGCYADRDGLRSRLAVLSR
jgi:gamma-butyrobetaine dioxygenase